MPFYENKILLNLSCFLFNIYSICSQPLVLGSSAASGRGNISQENLYIKNNLLTFSATIFAKFKVYKSLYATTDIGLFSSDLDNIYLILTSGVSYQYKRSSIGYKFYPSYLFINRTREFTPRPLNSIELEYLFNRWGVYLQYMSILGVIDHYYYSFDPNFYGCYNSYSYSAKLYK